MAVLDAWREKVSTWLEGQEAAFGPEAREGLDEAEGLAHGRAWQRQKSENGFAGISWPVDQGGAGLSPLHQSIFAEEELKRGFPVQYFAVSLGMPIPLMLMVGTEEQKKRFVPPAIRGEEIWCQLFSEPAAGSDLAALRTRASRADDGSGDWIVNGQKLWTSYAQHSDFGIIVVRTDPSVAKHKGLSFFWIDMRTPGVSVRPVKLLDGTADVNEVFFDNVRISDNQRIGPVGGGFGVALQTLVIERYSVGNDEAGFGPPLNMFINLARNTEINGRPAIEDGRIRSLIARNYALQAGLRDMRDKSFISFAQGEEAGAEGALHKLAAVRARQELARAAVDLLGVEGLCLPPAMADRNHWARSYLSAPPHRIAGGTDEILLNTIAERILGLPQDHRPDKGIAFSELLA